MKKKIIVLLIALIAYCWLFYDQFTGVNVIIFNVLLLASLIALDQTLLRSRSWLMVALGTIITGIGALLYGNFLSAFGNVISLLLLANLSLNKTSSLIFTFFQTVCSYVIIPYTVLDKLINNVPKEEAEKNGVESIFTFSNMLKFAIPLAILSLFFIIYRVSNPVFDQFMDQLKFDFLSWDFILFMIGGFILLYGFFFQQRLNFLMEMDARNDNQLVRKEEQETIDLSGRNKREFSMGIMTFALLNVLLLLVNVLDLQFIFGGHEHDGMNYSKYVHQGINSSVFSILIAIVVTLYFFRGDLNFMSKNKWLKYLAMTWILLNIVLLATCVHKNFSYITECGLTHKRIGVYVYIFLTLIGLITTWIKISGLKSNWFLVRKNMWSLYLVLILSSLFNWNKIIVDYNLKYKSSVEREYYLFRLGDTGLPVLQSQWRKMPETNDFWLYFRSDVYDFEAELNARIQTFISKYENAGWQSWNLEDQRIYQALKKSPHSKRAK